MRVLIVGCGYVGLPLAVELARQGHEVAGLARSRRAEAELKRHKIQLLLGDVAKAATLKLLPSGYDWVVNCVSSSGGGEAEYREVYLQGTRNLIEWLSPTPPREFVYTSSTSVYGQTDGSIVTEQSPTEPTTATSRILIETEQMLLAAAAQSKLPAVILRVAGIYGPERGYWFKQYLKNEATIEGSGERILNMIHRDDVVGAIIAALNHGAGGEVYNAADNEPVSQTDFFRWLSETLGRPMPPVVAEDRQTARKRGVTNKKVSNKRLKADLYYQFKHPTFREGYQDEIKRLSRGTAPDIKRSE